MTGLRTEGPAPLLFCDLTQSWSDVGGGVRTYLLHKRSHILANTPHRHLMIIPGERDRVSEDGRAITVTIASPKIPGSPHYRLMWRNRAVRAALERFRPHLVECQDAYNLPWAALRHRDRHPATAVTAVYMTDFPTVYVERPLSRFLGKRLARALGGVCYRYCASLYRRFDAVVALSENGGAATLRGLGIDSVDIVPLGVEVADFGPERRDDRLRSDLGLAKDQPLLIYVGRLDIEKRPDVVVDAFRKLPRALGAQLVLLGEGPLRADIEALADQRIHMPGYIRDRAELARWLASADLYVSAMPNETFGISIVEAQASGLPVVGVAAGAMVDRVGEGLGRLGPVGESDAMAANIVAMLDRSDLEQVRANARAHALTLSWDNGMASLFERVYPGALAARRNAGRFAHDRGGAALAKA